MADWVTETLKMQKGARERQAAIEASTDPGYLGGFVSSALSGIGEMFGMEPTLNAERFRRENPLGGLASEMTGVLVPYVGWEATLARAPKLAKSLGGAAEAVGISPVKRPITHGAVNLAVRYAPVELSRLGTGLVLTEDWDKYQGLMADVALSSALTGGFGGIGGFLRSAGPTQRLVDGRIAQAPTGLAAFAEYRIARHGNVTTLGDVPLEDVKQNLFKEVFTERPPVVRGSEKLVRTGVVNALEGVTEPSKVAWLNTIFNAGTKPRSATGLTRLKLMDENGNWTLGDEGNAEVLGALGFKSMDDLAESGRYPTVVDVGSGRAAGSLKRAMQGLSAVGDGAVMGRQAGNGLFAVGVRIKPGETAYTPKAGLHRYLGEVGAIKGGDRWFFTMTDKPQRFIKGAPKSAELTFNQFAKFREAFRPEVNTATLFNQRQNLVIQTLSPEDIANMRRGLPKEKLRAEWVRRQQQEVAGFLGIKDSEMLRRLWDDAHGAIVPAMFKGVNNSLYDRLYHMLRLNKETAETLTNKLIGGAVKLTRRRGFGVKGTHEAEVVPGVKTLNALLDEHRLALTEQDYRLIYAVGNAQAPKEMLAELTANGQISTAARAVLDGVEKIDRYFWEQMMPVAQGLGVQEKFNLLLGPYIPRIMKGDWYVPVMSEDGKQLKYLASGTRLQAQKEAEAFVKAGKDMGIGLKAGPTKSWYSGQAKDELFRLHQQMEMALMRDPEVDAIAKAAMRTMAIENAGMRSGLMRGAMPKSLTVERTGVAADTGGEYTAKQLITDVQEHYNMIGKYLGYQSWYQRWLPEVERLAKTDKKLADDLSQRAKMMQGYEGEQAKYLNKLLGGDSFLGASLGGKAASKIAQEANKLMYHWNIGIANPVFALVNLLTPLQTVAPWIAMMKTAPHAADDLMHTHFSFNADSKVSGIWNTLDVPKLMWKALKEIGAPGDDLLEHLGRAKTDGSLSPQLFENFVGHGSAASTSIRDSFHKAGGGVGGFWEATKNIATWASRHSEEWSREYAFTAGHIVGRDLMGLKGEALYRFAQRATHVTMYGYHAMDRSLMFTGPIGSTFGLFKNWQMHFIGSMLQYAGLGWREGNWAPLIWQFAGSLAVGGIGATPLVMVADQITKWIDNQPNSYLWMKENWHDSADEIYYGLPALFGASLQASSALPGTDVRNDLTMLSNFVFLERAKAAFKATKGAFDYADETGQNPLKNPNVRDALMQGYAPRALWRLFSATEQDAIKSMSSGYPQVRNVSLGAKWAYQLGMNPVEIEAQQDAARVLWKDQKAQREAIAAYGQRFAVAFQSRDVEEMNRTVLDAQARGIPLTSVAKSAQTRLRRELQHDLLSKYGGKGFEARRVLEAE